MMEKPMKDAILRSLPTEAPAMLRATKLCASAQSIFSSWLVAGAISLAAAAAVLPAHADGSPGVTEERPFIAESNAAMTKMMASMTIVPTGNVDHDFAAMMIPHHQGAIDMAEAELRYGQNQQLLRISQEIVVEQLQEIAAMRIAVGEKVSPYEAMLAASVPGAAAAPMAPPVPQTAGTLSVAAERPFRRESDTATTSMMDDMAIKPTGQVDRDFVAMMVPHHQGAIDMAEAELRYGRGAQLRRIAQEIIVDEMQQIALMRLAVGEGLPPPIASPTDPSRIQAPRAPTAIRPAPEMSMQMASHQTTIK
jgi:uncharacterized protein (DUF305 family)